MLLSLAERAGAVELSRAGRAACSCGQPARAARARRGRRSRRRGIAAGSPTARSSASCPLRALPPPADPRPLRRLLAGRAAGRCCDVCDPDRELLGLLQAPLSPVPSPRRAQSRPLATSLRAPRAERSRPRATGGHGLAATLVDPREFERLRAWRLDRARGLPAYTVASNSVLEEILRQQPGDLEELLALRGVGPAFCAKHGAALLAELRKLGAAARSASGSVTRGPAALGSKVAPT